jgi:hypothetical protein
MLTHQRPGADTKKETRKKIQGGGRESKKSNSRKIQ